MTNLAKADTASDVAIVAYVEDAKKAISAVRTLQREVLRDGVDFGVIPGTGDKPTLYKSGAESLLLGFRLSTGEPDIEYVDRAHIAAGHFDIRVRVPIVHRESGSVIGYGVGSCSTLEKKYRYRQAERKCPACGKGAIIKGKAEYGGGWVCFRKKGGCGAKFADRDETIIGQEVGQIENPDIADQYNTVLKMAKKRALVDGALTCTAASGVFTQDVEDMPEYERYVDPKQEITVEAETQPERTETPVADEKPALSAIPLGEPVTVNLSRGERMGSGAIRWRVEAESCNAIVAYCWHKNQPVEATGQDDPENYDGPAIVMLSKNAEGYFIIDEITGVSDA